MTKTVVEKLAVPESGQAFYRDSEIKGFGVRVTAGGARSFILEKRINGKVRRQTVGRFGELTCEQARTKALRLLGQMAMGIDPIQEREKERMSRVTLEDAFKEFKKARSNLSDRTIYDYGRMVEGPLKDWKILPLQRITRDKVLNRHRKIGTERGEYYANGTMRFLSSVLNFASAHYMDGYGEPIIKENPVEYLRRIRAWYPVERRRTVIKVHQLPEWYRAVSALYDGAHTLSEAETVADFLLFLLFTGLRRNEAAQLTWAAVDLKAKTFELAKTKNKQVHALPLSDYMANMLEGRKEVARNAYVFPGNGRKGYLIEPKRPIHQVIERSGVQFSLHDLRRTFATVAEALEVSPYTIKRLLNHKMAGDVTAGYIISDVERLRKDVQRISDFLLSAMEIRQSVVALPGAVLS